MKSRYELTLVSAENGWVIECWDTLHHMWLRDVELGAMSRKKAEAKLQALYRSLNG